MDLKEHNQNIEQTKQKMSPKKNSPETKEKSKINKYIQKMSRNPHEGKINLDNILLLNDKYNKFLNKNIVWIKN